MRRRTIFFIIISLLWLGVILLFSVQPTEVSNDISVSLVEIFLIRFLPEHSGEALANANVLLRKFAHFFEYFVLGLLCALVLKQTRVHYKAVFGIAFGVLVAIVDEMLQLSASGRTGQLTDVLIDGAGVILGVGIVFLVDEKRKRTKDL